MARKKKDKTAGGDGADEKTKGKAKSNLVPAVIIAVGLLAGGKMMGGGGGGGAVPAAGAEATTTTVALGEVVKLDSVTLNLSDGHYLKLGLALQLSAKIKAEELTKSGKTAKAIDIAITQLGEQSMADLQPPKAREKAKEKLSEAVAKAFDDEVVAVYITEFVMQ